MENNSNNNIKAFNIKTWAYLFLPIILYVFLSWLLEIILSALEIRVHLYPLIKTIILLFILCLFLFYHIRKNDLKADSFISLPRSKELALVIVIAVVLGFISKFALRALAPNTVAIPFDLLNVLTYVILVPLLEETLYRGYFIQQGEKIMGRTTAVVLSTLLFAFAHRTTAQILMSIPIGFILSLVYAKGRNLLYPILIHGIINLIILI